MTKELYEFCLEEGVEMCYKGGEPFPAYNFWTTSQMERFQRFIENKSKQDEKK